MQYTTDPSEYLAMLASIHSALRNSADPGRLRFHLTIPDWADERGLCYRLLRSMRRWGGGDGGEMGWLCVWCVCVCLGGWGGSTGVEE